MLKILFACALLAGCIKAKPETAPEEISFDIPSDPIAVELPPVAPAAEQTPAPVPDPISTYTGIRIYSDQATCNPCRNVHTDLVWLCENYGWTISESVRMNAHWQILPPRETDTRIPLIEVWTNGRLINTQTGYENSDDPELREAALAKLVRLHPRGRK